MSALDDFMAQFADVLHPVETAREPRTDSMSIATDPCARLSVQAVSGGMRDAPVVKHRMRLKRSQQCRRECGRTCRRDCEQVYALDPDFHPDGECICPPVDVARHYANEEGIRARGIPAPFKRMARGRFADDTQFRDTPRTFVSTGGTATRRPLEPRFALDNRHAMALLIAAGSSLAPSLARMALEKRGHVYHACGRTVCYSH